LSLLLPYPAEKKKKRNSPRPLITGCLRRRYAYEKTDLFSDKQVRFAGARCCCPIGF
jgi:hypothetical protein